jgi:hypothetical protein
LWIGNLRYVHEAIGDSNYKMGYRNNNILILLVLVVCVCCDDFVRGNQHPQQQQQQQQQQRQYKNVAHSLSSTFVPRDALLLTRRGGSSTAVMEEDDEASAEEKEALAEAERRKAALEKYHMEQSVLLSLRSTFLSEVLAKRGVPIATMMDVSTTDGDKPPETTDWDCALSTEEDPKTCLYSFDAELNSKVVAPVGTTQYISLSALNRLRRTDTSKVEPMWHSKYAILSSWFSDESEFSLLQHTGIAGFLVSNLLLDSMGLRFLLSTGVIMGLLLTLPLWELLVEKVLLSSYFWNQWNTWGRFAHAALPLKLLLGQMTWKFVAQSFLTLENYVRDIIVDYECTLLEQTIPITIGKESQIDNNNDDDDDDAIKFDVSEDDNDTDTIESSSEENDFDFTDSDDE